MTVTCLACLFGCGGAEAPTDGRGPSALDWAAGRDTARAHVVSEDPRICRDCADFEPLVTLGDEGDGFLQPVLFAAVDSLGRFWVSQQHGPKVFASSGDFIRAVGREGQGPGEFLDQREIFVDGSGRVHLFDGRNLRVTVVDTAFGLVEDHRLPQRFHEVEPLGGDGELVASFSSPDPSRVGLPVHLLRDYRTWTSLGPIDGVEPVFSPRRLTVDSRGRIFAMPHSEYVIDAWSSAGARLATFTRRGLFEPPPEDGSDLPLGERPPHPYVPAIHADGEGRLRVISWLPRQDWRDGLEEVRMPDGTISLSPRDRDPASVQRAVIEIIDLGSRSVVAQIEAPALVQGFLGDDMVYATIHEPSGEVKMAVWSFTLTLPP